MGGLSKENKLEILQVVSAYLLPNECIYLIFMFHEGTSRDTSRSLVSHDMIQQLLKNPRATMLQSSQLGDWAQDYEEEEEEEEEELGDMSPNR